MKIVSEKLTRRHEGTPYEQKLIVTGSPAELLLIDEALYDRGFVTTHQDEGKLILSCFIEKVEEHDKLIDLVNSIASDIQLVPGLIGALDRIMEKPDEMDRVKAVFAEVGDGNGNGHNGHR